MEEKKIQRPKRCTLGWTWGHYDLKDDTFMFKVNNQE
jgi:hypothetical protein